MIPDIFNSKLQGCCDVVCVLVVGRVCMDSANWWSDNGVFEIKWRWFCRSWLCLSATLSRDGGEERLGSRCESFTCCEGGQKLCG